MAKRPRDPNALAAVIVREATGEIEHSKPAARDETRAAGGKKGGKARAEKLTPKQRSEIARKAAEARWGIRPQP